MRTLAARIVALVVAVALAGAVVTAVLLVRAIGQGNRDRVGAVLAVQADALADRAATGRPAGVSALETRFANRGSTALVAGPGDPLPAPFVPGDLSGATAGSDAVDRDVEGQSWLVVTRPVGDGRAALVARRLTAAATGLTAAQRRRVVLGALGVLAVGALGGLVLARTVERPLRQVATAARRLSAGERDVHAGAGGPREVRDVALALDTLAAQLTASEERQRRFLLAVSHELRTPLTAVTGYAEALADGVLPPEETARAGGVIKAEAGRLQRRVDDLMALARVQADDFPLELAPVDLAELVDAAATAALPRARAAGVPLHTEIRPATATTDGERVRQAVDALVDNALRVLPAGAPLVLASGSDGRQAWVQVRDGGPGLPPEDLAAAFQPGVLTERYRGRRPVGSGLGLALVAGLAERMGGRAVASPAPEGGVCFTVVLPAA